jgi:hypothetical protein
LTKSRKKIKFLITSATNKYVLTSHYLVSFKNMHKKKLDL